MTRPDPQREPRTETAEKKGIGKTHEEFIGDMAGPSISRKEYEERKREERNKSEVCAPVTPDDTESH